MQEVARGKLEARRRQMALKRSAKDELANDEKLREAEEAKLADVTHASGKWQTTTIIYM